MLLPLLVVAAVPVEVPEVRDVPEDLSEHIVALVRTQVADITPEAGESLRLRLLGGVTRILVLVERASSGAQKKEIELAGPTKAEGWDDIIHAGIAELFPPKLPSEATRTEAISQDLEDGGGGRWAPYVLAGGGLAVAAVGIFFAASAASTRSELNQRQFVDDDFRALESDMNRSRTISFVLLGTGGAALATGLIWALAD